MAEHSLVDTVAGKRGILFDLFHTLTSLEATSPHRLSTSELLGIDRHRWDEQLLLTSNQRLTGQLTDPFTIMEIMAHAVDPSIPASVIREAATNRLERFACALQNVPASTMRGLRALKAVGKTLGLVSNADVAEVAAWAGSPLAGMFDSAVFSCQAGCVKPDPRIYERCLNELDLRAEQCIFAGDGGSRELEGARSIGLTTVMVTGFIQNLWPEKIEATSRYADFRVGKVEELVPYPPAIIFDWGDTVMRDFPQFRGPMVDWPVVEAIPGVREALGALKGRHVLVLASNAGDSDAERMCRALARVGLDGLFDYAFTSKELGAAKPDPRFFTEICDRLGLEPCQCAMVGNDAVKDISGARVAGLRTIWFSADGQPTSLPAADVVIRHMPDLPVALGALRVPGVQARLENRYRTGTQRNTPMLVSVAGCVLHCAICKPQ